MRKIADNYAHQDDDSEGFYSRWSNRKFQTQINEHHQTQTLSTDTGSDNTLSPELTPQLSPQIGQEKELLSDKDMPDLDTLNEDSDYSGFLSPGVSEKLRKLALRKLFQGQSFNLCDGLDDYDEEFTSFEKLGDIVTADMRFQIEEEAKRKLQLAQENDDIKDDILDERDEVSELNEDGSESTESLLMDDPPVAENTVMNDNKNDSNRLENSKPLAKNYLELRENENLS